MIIVQIRYVIHIVKTLFINHIQLMEWWGQAQHPI
jgi:hypothetical protein